MKFSPLITLPVNFWFLAYCGITFEKKVLVKDIAIQILLRRFEELNKRVSQLEKENKALRDEIVLLKGENTRLREEIVLLKAENADLKARLNSDSHNSNKPPSSDGYKKKTIKPAFPKGKNSRQGGQEGHEGKTLRQVEVPDKIVVCAPGVCSCGHEFTEKEFRLAEKRQVFDLPQPKLDITEYQIFKGCCPVCGREQKGAAPEGVNSPVQYGNNVKALAVLLNVHYRIPYKKMQALFCDLFGYPVNESTIIQAGETCYRELEESEQMIKSKILEGEVAHADETGIRVEGKLQWLHTATSLLYTYLFVHEKRGAGAIESEKSILMDYIGWLVHDCWSSYFNLKNLKHAICCAHILRELDALIEHFQSKWAKVFRSFLLSVYQMPFEQRILHKELIESRYDRICRLGEKAEPPPIKIPGKKGRCKSTKGRNLVERLISKKEAVLAFAFNREVPFTNNQAERDLRAAKVKQKVSNCFRTFRGAEFYARIEGFISTARKNQRNVFTELCATFEGHNFITS